jgi:(2Fe-2S) ferredoxin
VNRSGCLNACGLGPTCVVYPDGVWYGNVQRADADEIFRSHLIEGVPVERLRLPPDFVKRTDHYPAPVQQFKRVERALDDQRRAAREEVRAELRAELDAEPGMAGEAWTHTGTEPSNPREQVTSPSPATGAEPRSG